MPTEEQKLAKKEYLRTYYLNNKEKLIEKKKAYYQENIEKRKEYVLNNKEKIKLHRQKYYLNNKELVIKKQTDYSNANTNKIKTYQKEYRQKNKDKRNCRERERNQNDPMYRLHNRIRMAIKDSLKQNGFRKTSKTYEILGCSPQEFKEHLEAQFEPWMNWNNRGLYNGNANYGWDIDHIIPISSGLTEEDIIRLNHHTNLQPLCSYINRDIKKNNT